MARAPLDPLLIFHIGINTRINQCGAINFLDVGHKRHKIDLYPATCSSHIFMTVFYRPVAGSMAPLVPSIHYCNYSTCRIMADILIIFATVVIITSRIRIRRV